MSSTKRVTGNYDIYADTVTVNGNLTVVGTSTSFETINSEISDNIIILNSGEVGAGITLGFSGLQIDRGSLPDVTLRYNESTDKWQFTNDGVNYSDIAAAGPANAGGSNTFVQYNNAGTLDGEANFSYNFSSNTLFIGNIQVNQNTISTHSTNGNLILDTNGTGRLVVNTVTSLEHQGSDPGSTASYTHIYGKAPGSGNTGIYFVNTTTSGEVASVNKSLLLSLIL